MKDFIKQTFASLIGTVAGLMLFGALGVSGLVMLIITAASQESGPVVKDKSVLVFDLATQIRDTEPQSTLGDALAGSEVNSIPLRTVLNAIEKATKDDRIVALFIDGSKSSDSLTGYATLKEVRAALEEFKAAGKQIIAYDVDLGEREYYLSSIADRVILNPMGALELNGFSSEPLFLAEALDKYGIGIQIVRVGQFKSAVEPFTRQDLSPENRQQTEQLLGDLWQEYITVVGESRKLKTTQLQAIADTQGFLLPNEAKGSGLVDQVAYLDQVIDDLKKLTDRKEDDKSFRKISLGSYADVPVKNVKERFSKNKIAIVYAEGSIVNGEGTLDSIGGDRFANQIRKIRQDENVKAVVIRINSPGGSATASEIILRELQLINQEKPVIISMGDVAASGGYWIATGGNQIFAQANTITGSIGVFGILPNVQEIANNNGITWDVVKTGELADLGTASRPKTEAELAIYQKAVNQVYTEFLNKVAKARNLPKEKVAEIAQGRVWSGEDAKALGLVDEIGGIDAAIEAAAAKAELEDDWEVQEYPKNRSLEERILETVIGEASVKNAKTVDPLTAEFLKLKEDLAVFQTLNDPRGVYVRLPFNLRID
ncbi:MAG: signal peptide peptidase SppA [Halothece sp.]